jgi:phage terminase small subunit
MARHPQPREIADLKGATRHDPQRYRKEMPAVDQPLGNPPEKLSVEAQSAWFELSGLAPTGVLKGSDRIMLEMAAVLLVKFRADPDEFPSSKMTHLIGILARLGMSPADRQKLGTEKLPEGNPFDSF